MRQTQAGNPKFLKKSCVSPEERETSGCGSAAAAQAAAHSARHSVNVDFMVCRCWAIKYGPETLKAIV